jgi:hypothetical protein
MGASPISPRREASQRASAARAGVSAGRLVSGLFAISDADERSSACLRSRARTIFRYRGARAVGLEPALLRARGAWRGASASTPVALILARRLFAVSRAMRASPAGSASAPPVAGRWCCVLSFPPGLAPLFDALWLAGLALPRALVARQGRLVGVLAFAAAPSSRCGRGLAVGDDAGLWLAAAAGWLAGRLLALGIGRRRGCA